MTDFNVAVPQIPPASFTCGRCGSSEQIIKGPRVNQEAQYQLFRNKHKDCKWGTATEIKELPTD